MAYASASRAADLGQALLETYVVNDHINQIILEHLEPRAWRAKPVGRNARTIAAIFTHMHNVRRKWLRLTAPHIKLPAQLDRARCTQKQASKVLAESGLRCSAMLAEALCKPEGRLQQFRRDGWSKPWPAGAAMVAYMLSHEAHHRGQVCMLAHQLGYPLPSKVTSEMWSWERLWKRCGFAQPR
jgi:uncharacterized damage-inducible protein DinB